MTWPGYTDCSHEFLRDLSQLLQCSRSTLKERDWLQSRRSQELQLPKTRNQVSLHEPTPVQYTIKPVSIASCQQKHRKTVQQTCSNVADVSMLGLVWTRNYSHGWTDADSVGKAVCVQAQATQTNSYNICESSQSLGIYIYAQVLHWSAPYSYKYYREGAWHWWAATCQLPDCSIWEIPRLRSHLFQQQLHVPESPEGCFWVLLP